jgi:hypothetical protein
VSDLPTGSGGPPAPGWWQASDGNWYPPDQVPGYAPTPPTPPPGYGAPGANPYGYGYGYPLQPTQKNNGMALAALISSCVAVFICGIGFILGVIFGHIALSQIKQTGEGGRGMAVAGLVIGYIGIVVMIVVLIALFAVSDGDNELNFDSIVRTWTS